MLVIDKKPNKKLSRKPGGRWDTVRYKVLHRVRWAALKHDCLDLRYDEDGSQKYRAAHWQSFFQPKRGRGSCCEYLVAASRRAC